MLTSPSTAKINDLRDGALFTYSGLVMVDAGIQEQISWEYQFQRLIYDICLSISNLWNTS